MDSRDTSSLATEMGTCIMREASHTMAWEVAALRKALGEEVRIDPVVDAALTVMGVSSMLPALLEHLEARGFYPCTFAPESGTVWIRARSAWPGGIGTYRNMIEALKKQICRYYVEQGAIPEEREKANETEEVGQDCKGAG